MSNFERGERDRVAQEVPLNEALHALLIVAFVLAAACALISIYRDEYRASFETEGK